MAKNKYYVVRDPKGEEHIFTTWRETQEAIKGLSGVQYKGFPDLSSAKTWLSHISQEKDNTNADIYIYVDGSFISSTPYAGWAIVAVREDEIIHEASGLTPEKAVSRNIDGELYAAVVAVDWASSQNLKACIVYDYQGIQYWPEGKWQAKSPIAKAYVKRLHNKLDHISFKKVKGHSGDLFNDRADHLAKEAITLYNKKNEN